MNKFIVAALGIVTLFSIQSCTKPDEDITITQTVNARISANETYTYTLPANVSSHDFGITSPGNHASVSAIQKDVAGSLTYIYKPAPGFTGTDHIVISTIGENENEGEMHDGNCNGDNHDCDNHDGDNDNDKEGDHAKCEKNHEHGHRDSDKNMVIN